MAAWKEPALLIRTTPRAAILHLGDSGIGIIRVDPFFLRLRSNRASCSRVGFSIPVALASLVPQIVVIFLTVIRRTR